MFSPESDFFKRSIKVAEKFLQSAVIVDDHAYFEKVQLIKEVGQLKKPHPMRSLKRSKVNDVLSDSKHKIEDPKEQIDTQRFDAKLVIDSFAKKGIICSVLRPDRKDKETLVDTLSKLAIEADIIIIDWSLNKDNGEKAKEFIKNILRPNSDIPKQLRLVAIYTGNPAISIIFNELKRILKGCSINDDGFSLYTPTLRVSIYAKPQTSVPDSYSKRIIAFEDLADKMTEDFTAMTAGLVSNSVLESLAQIRKNTHKILRNFSSDLDAPYLTHRALLDNPADAEDHITALIVEELRAILEEINVGKTSDLKCIKDWLKGNADTDSKYKLQDGTSVKEFLVKDIIKMLKDGFEKWPKKKLLTSKGHKLFLTKMFNFKDKDPMYLDEMFALKTSFRTYYERLSPKLTLGTIIKKESKNNNEYLVCIQPRCDCIRITQSSRFFPFLPFEIVRKKNKKFDLVVEEEKEHIRLIIINNPYSLQMIHFPAITENLIASFNKEGKESHYFKDYKKVEYKWVGELKSEHAFRIANDFTEKLSRIGLNESEWLRRWKKG